LLAGDWDMPYKPVRATRQHLRAQRRSAPHKWYSDVFGLHTQDTMTFRETTKLARSLPPRATRATLTTSPLFEVGGKTPWDRRRKQVGLNHVAWRMGSLETWRKCIAAEGKESHQRLGPYRLDRWSTSRIPTKRARGLLRAARSEWHREKPFFEQGAKGRFPVRGTRSFQQSPPAFARA